MISTPVMSLTITASMCWARLMTSPLTWGVVRAARDSNPQRPDP